ncbi:MAG: hypothetical protein AB7Q42_14840 [Acidimicrobiia bacterium]
MNMATMNTLAWAIARDGITAHDAAVTSALRRSGGDAGNMELVRIVLDRSQPAVARERAFGRLIATSETRIRAA